MRWIVGTSLRFRWLVVFAAAALMAFGFAQIPNTKVDVFPEFAPPQRRDPDDRARQLLQRGRGAHHGPDRGRSSTGSRASTSCAPSRSRSSPRSELIFERGTDELRARQLVQERLAQVTPNLPTLGQPAVHDAAAVGDQPDHEDRPRPRTTLNLIEHVGDRLLEDQPAPAARARASRTSTSTASGSSSATCRSTRRSSREYGVSLDTVMDATADALDAGLLQYSEGVRASAPAASSRTDGQRLNVRNVQADRRTRRSSAEVPVARARRQDAAPGRPRPGARGPPCRSGATPSSTTAPA